MDQNYYKTQRRDCWEIISAVFLLAAMGLVCLLLFRDNNMPISITTVWNMLIRITQHFQLIAVVLLPVYIALMVFGAAVGGLMLGGLLKKGLRYYRRR